MDEPLETPRNDQQLLRAVRAGDPDGLPALRARHIAAAQRLARGLTDRAQDADGLVSAAIEQAHEEIRRDLGPDAAFRPYLLKLIRDRFRERGLQSGPEEPMPVELATVAHAFGRLPERWQLALWHTEVDGDSPETVVSLLGLPPEDLTPLLLRARDRLRQHYVDEHLGRPHPSNCRSIVDQAGAYARTALPASERARVDDHLAGCGGCRLLYSELEDMSGSLRAVLARAVLGGAAATAYLGASTAGRLGRLWTTTRRVAARRSTQVGTAVLATGLTLALLVNPSGPSGGPGRQPPVQPNPEPGAVPPAVPVDPSAGDDTSDPDGAAGPDAATPSFALAVSLEPVGSLVRGRPAVLALTATAEESGGSGGWVMAASRSERAESGQAGTGPLAATVTLPDGVDLRGGDLGGRWQCAQTGREVACQGPSLPAGATTEAFLPVTVAASAEPGIPKVRVTGPDVAPAEAATGSGVGSAGLGAVFAGVLPGDVVTGGNALLSCHGLDIECRRARAGRPSSLLGRIDNEEFWMDLFADPAAPAGAPEGAAVSGARIPVSGEVVWARLYWAGTGRPLASPTAYLRAPGTGQYQPVTAGWVHRVDAAALGLPAYQASAEVTDLVRGGGDWWVAVDDEELSVGVGAFGGWALVVVAEGGGQDRSVAVFDDLTPLPEQSSFTAELYGQPGAATVGFVGWEGDRDVAGEGLVLDGGPLGGVDLRDIAGSRAAGTPGGWNTFGTDARLLAAAITDATTRPVLTATAGQDAWLLGPVTVVSPSG